MRVFGNHLSINVIPSVQKSKIQQNKSRNIRTIRTVKPIPLKPEPNVRHLLEPNETGTGYCLKFKIRNRRILEPAFKIRGRCNHLLLSILHPLRNQKFKIACNLSIFIQCNCLPLKRPLKLVRKYFSCEESSFDHMYLFSN